MKFKHIISAQDALDMLEASTAKFVDASWYLPSQKRNGKEEFAKSRIPGAVFFDIDAISDQSVDLPHMLPDPQAFDAAMSKLGISNDDTIIVYDGPGMFSVARVWWTLKVMGVQSVKILEGGFDAWRESGFKIETGSPVLPQPGNFKSNFEADRVANLDDVLANIENQGAITLDARPGERFYGKAPEPRPGMRSGHIPGSKSLPAATLVYEGRLLDPADLETHLQSVGIGSDNPVIATCGSGVTAAILVLALEETGRSKHRLFDGSWAQWGKPGGPEIALDD